VKPSTLLLWINRSKPSSSCVGVGASRCSGFVDGAILQDAFFPGRMAFAVMAEGTQAVSNSASITKALP
jgi:hypothetical protein